MSGKNHISLDDESVSAEGIRMRKEQIAIIAFAVWLTLIAVFMFLVQRVDLEIFFVLSLVGFLVIVELAAPRYIQPNSLRYTWYLQGAGIVIIGVIVVLKVLEILRLGIVFR